jgi:hypothetical protein
MTADFTFTLHYHTIGLEPREPSVDAALGRFLCEGAISLDQRLGRVFRR